MNSAHDSQKNDAENMLVEYGLTRTEAIVYLALLKRGKTTAYRISKDAKLYKANTYQAIDSLIKKGLATNILVNEKNLLNAVPPEKFVNLLELQKEKMQSVIPKIERSFAEDSEGIFVFTGIKSFMNILYSFLPKGDSILAFDIPEYVPDLVRTYINQFHKERIKKKIKMYHIYDYDAKERIKYLLKLKYTYAKSGKVNRHSIVSTIICGDTALIINWLKDVKTVQIIDKDVADAYKKQFWLLWDEK